MYANVCIGRIVWKIRTARLRVVDSNNETCCESLLLIWQTERKEKRVRHDKRNTVLVIVTCADFSHRHVKSSGNDVLFPTSIRTCSTDANGDTTEPTILYAYYVLYIPHAQYSRRPFANNAIVIPCNFVCPGV